MCVCCDVLLMFCSFYAYVCVLRIARACNDDIMFFAAFKFFQSRNELLRSSSMFLDSDLCAEYVAYYNGIINNNTSSSSSSNDSSVNDSSSSSSSIINNNTSSSNSIVSSSSSGGRYEDYYELHFKVGSVDVQQNIQ